MPWLHRLCVPGHPVGVGDGPLGPLAPRVVATGRTPAVAARSTSSARRASVNEAATPTCCSSPSSYRPSSSDPSSGRSGRGGLVQPVAGEHDVGGAGVLDLQHRARVLLVRRGHRLGDHPVEAGALEVLEPVRAPRPGRASSGSGARAGSGRGRRAPPRAGPGARRTAAPVRSSSPRASASKATKLAGVCSASRLIRDAAGWIRSCSVSNSSRDPGADARRRARRRARTAGGSCSRIAATTSGK